MITISERAIQELSRAIEKQKEDPQSGEVYVRVAVKGGGCSGFQNSLSLEEGEPTKNDVVYETSGLKFAIDNRSLMYLEGTKLDFIDELNRHGFKFTNPGVKSVCGCGSSFQM